MKFLAEVISQLFHDEAESNEIKSVIGGCIHQAGVFRHRDTNYFIKWNPGASHMFATEAQGLSLLGSADAIDVPKVIGKGCAEGIDYLCLSYVEKSIPVARFWEDFGSQLAGLHRQTHEYFGLDHDNFIGSLPQSNTRHERWSDFFVQERLMPQLKSATDKGLITHDLNKKFESLYKLLPALIPEESPALLHGDLWSGNFLVGDRGQPVIFDPAVYFGHREAELAFTRMFGGFDELFYQSYQEAFPMQPEYKKRVDLFNLYPLLVHVNLFGASYLSGIQRTLSRFA